MMQARPAVLEIWRSSPSAGHSIVVDGYHPTNDDYHLNYGWYGTNDGWYSLPSVLPGPPAESWDFDIIDEAVYNIVPTTSTYTLSTGTSGTGTGTVQALPGTGVQTRGTHVLLSATPTGGSTFDGWTGDLSGTDNPALLILDGSKSVTAESSGSGGPLSSKKWTILFYLADDNSLGGGASSDPDFIDFDEIETALVTSGSALEVVVLWDQPGQNDSFIYWVQADATEEQLASYTTNVNKWVPPWATEVNVGAQSSLTSFIDWVDARFDSDFYGLVLWNHGGGWQPKSLPSDAKADRALPTPDEDLPRGICWDDTDSGDYLTTKEVANGISGSTRSGFHNLGMDACVMQLLSVAYEVRDVALYLTASQANEWGYGWAYHQILSPITTSTTPSQLAQLWGSTRSKHFSGGLDTISSLNLSQVGSLASSLGSRLSALLSNEARYNEILDARMIETLSVSSYEYVDLHDLCQALADRVGDATVRSRAATVQSQLASTVMTESHSGSYSDTHGLSIYFPSESDTCWWVSHADYNATNFAFCTDYAWDNFLNAWVTTDYPDPYEPNETPAAASNLGRFPGGDVHTCDEADFDSSSVDWYKFTAEHTFDLDLQTYTTSCWSDTVVYVYNSLANANSGTYFAYNDDGGVGLGSRVTASGLAAGTYYIRVIPYGGSSGTEQDYLMQLRLDGSPAFRVDASGNVHSDQTFTASSFQTGAADVAEWVNVSEPVEAGDVLELDPETPGCYRKARGLSARVAGVVSTMPGFTLRGETRGERALLALVGFVPTRACDEGGAIELGSLLVAADRPGYVRRWMPEDGSEGIVGKAMEYLVVGEETILILLAR